MDQIISKLLHTIIAQICDKRVCLLIVKIVFLFSATGNTDESGYGHGRHLLKKICLNVDAKDFGQITSLTELFSMYTLISLAYSHLTSS